MTSFPCWGCHHKIGDADSTRLVIVTALGLTIEIRQSSVIHCGCGGATLWQRAKRREDTKPVPIFQPCYNEAVEV